MRCGSELRRGGRARQQHTHANSPYHVRVGDRDRFIKFYAECYDISSGYGHIALEVANVYKATDDDIKLRGCKVLRDAGPMNAWTTIISFVEDPDVLVSSH